MIHCIYGIYHLSRAAGGRTPGSSAAYHTFAGISDLCVAPIFAYGILAIRDNGSKWATILPNQGAMDVIIPAVYYLLIADSALHLLSLAISLWLGVMFRRIQNMPPDMNPLESHLTARPHKRNKSSITTTSTYTESEKRLSTPLEERRRSGTPYEDISRGPRVPFMHTRQGSDTSLRTRDSRVDLPSRQYQITPSNSPRNSATSADLKRMSAPPPPRSSHRGSYAEIPLAGTSSRGSSAYGYAQAYASPSSPTQASSSSRPNSSSRLSTGTVASHRATPTVPKHQTAQPARAARFTEAWYASDSLISRTQQRAREMGRPGAAAIAPSSRRAYEAIAQPYDDGDSESDSDAGIRPDENESDLGSATGHPNPLRCNPLAPPPASRGPALADIALNDRRVSGSRDIVDEKPAAAALASTRYQQQQNLLLKKNHPQLVPRNRNSSIQPESDFFYSKPYGELKPATPPVMVGSGRQVSSGNDYGAGAGVGAEAGFSSTFGRRGVSGKIAEEGRVGEERGYSRYGGLDE